MTIAIQLTGTGGPDVLVPHSVEVPPRGPGEGLRRRPRLGSCDLAQEVSRLTDGWKADVVYDGIGGETFGASVDSLKPRD